MNIDYYKTAYTNSGFFWNSQLELLVELYAGKPLQCRHWKTGKMEDLSFFDFSTLFGPLGRKFSKYNSLYEFFDEDVAPVGIAYKGHIELHICESGRFFGYSDGLILQWGEAIGWESQILNLMKGDRPMKIGLTD